MQTPRCLTPDQCRKISLTLIVHKKDHLSVVCSCSTTPFISQEVKTKNLIWTPPEAPHLLWQFHLSWEGHTIITEVATQQSQVTKKLRRLGWNSKKAGKNVRSKPTERLLSFSDKVKLEAYAKLCLASVNYDNLNVTLASCPCVSGHGPSEAQRPKRRRWSQEWLDRNQHTMNIQYLDHKDDGEQGVYWGMEAAGMREATSQVLRDVEQYAWKRSEGSE